MGVEQAHCVENRYNRNDDRYWRRKALKNRQADVKPLRPET